MHSNSGIKGYCASDGCFNLIDKDATDEYMIMIKAV